MFIFIIFCKKQTRKGRNAQFALSYRRVGFFLDVPYPENYHPFVFMEISTLTSLNSEQLRAAMRGWSAGVTVVAATHEGQTHGMTVNSFTSISLDPAMITISLQGSTRTHEMVSKSRAFGLTILSKEQAAISDLFAGRSPEVTDRFAGLQTETLVTGSTIPRGRNCLSGLPCDPNF